MKHPANPSILVADADIDTRALYRAFCELSQCEVVEACDGRDALTHALTRTPALVITELTLPLIDGYALCEVLRRDRATADVPILVVTAEAGSAAGQRARLAGADSVIIKPTTPERVIEEMQRLLAHRGMRADCADDTGPCVEGIRPRPRRGTALSKTHERFVTKTPPAAPPTLSCPRCDRSLRYQCSHIGGVSVRQSEQWDEYTCAKCGAFWYRHRTRTLRHVG